MNTSVRMLASPLNDFRRMSYLSSRMSASSNDTLPTSRSVQSQRPTSGTIYRKKNKWIRGEYLHLPWEIYVGQFTLLARFVLKNRGSIDCEANDEQLRSFFMQYTVIYS